MPRSDYWPFANNPQNQLDIQEDESILQKQLGDMEGTVKEMQMELAAIKRDRMNLSTQNIFPDTEEILKGASIISQSYKVKGDHSDELPEIMKLREDLLRAKNKAEQEMLQRQNYESKLRDLEIKLSIICRSEMLSKTKEHRQFSEDEVAGLKTQIRDLKDEIEELKITVTEKTEQLQEYRVKYLQAQQEVEELKRQVDMIEFDNRQVSDQIQMEIQKMKMQFQEKLQELAPLPDLLKGAQIQLQEAKQLQQLAEESAQQLSNELQRIKEKLVMAVNNLNQEKHAKTKIIEESKAIKTCLEEKGKEIDELNKNVDDLKSQILRLDEKLSQEELRYKEKARQCSQLIQDLDELRVKSNRTLSRHKERSESTRRCLQTQISELERQLIQSRAQCRAFQKERDEIRQRMQIQVKNLQENFELVEIRLRALQNQVTSLKNSFTVILADDEDNGEINKIATT